ncbi:MAG TPA: hypothetical protein VIE65_07520 [Methylobacter sp.]|jgi:hypothetical protein
MSVTLARVINQQTIPAGLSRSGSILIDKIDRSQGNSSNIPYAQRRKQAIYIPRVNPLNTAVKGYVDLVQTDEVKLALEAHGSIGGLVNATPARVSVTLFDSSLSATPTLASANHTDPVVLAGTIFLSVAPDLTYVEVTNPSGVKQLVPSASFTGGAPDSAIQIRIPFSSITIGTPIAGWKYRVFANSKYSNQVTAS